MVKGEVMGALWPCERCGALFPIADENSRFCSRRCNGGKGRPSSHTQGFIREALKLWKRGLSYTEVGQALGVTKGTIAGIAHRNDFPHRNAGGTA